MCQFIMIEMKLLTQDCKIVIGLQKNVDLTGFFGHCMAWLIIEYDDFKCGGVTESYVFVV